MCWISPSRCWCWAPDMWSWNSFNTKEQGRGMRREPWNGGQGGAHRGGLQPQLHGHPTTAEAISLTTLCGPEKTGKLRHRVSAQ